MTSTARRFAPFALSLMLGAMPVPAYAQTADPVRDDGHRPVHPATDTTNDEIVVAGHPPINFGILAATASLSGDRLTEESRGQIGEMLTSLPGVSATSFAPGASRPILRGFSGDRVAILTDGIGSIDASTVSNDHAVVLDALSVDHIDIFHGPAVLLFGGNAIGGAVNALDKRIPRTVPGSPTATAIAGYASAAQERSFAGTIDVPLAPRLVAHLDADWRKSDDLRTGGRLVAPGLRDILLADGLDDEANRSGRIPDSAARGKTLGAGLAFIDQRGNLGVSVARFNTRYGVPARPGSADAGGDGVSIDMAQTRVDMRGELKFDGLLESLQFRGMYGTYRHAELEGAQVGTRFAGKGIEFRADLIQANRNGWRGRSGVQYGDRDLTISGDEAFTPNNHTNRLGLFTLQSVEIGSGLTVEGAGRYEHVRVSAPDVGFSRNYPLWSGAAGISWKGGAGLSLGVNYVRGARAPSPEELLSNGFHAATQSYERGDRGFSTEKSKGFEGYVRYAAGGTEASLTGFATRFDGFIASLPTGEELEGYPVYRYRQSGARFTGFEASASHEILDWADGGLTLQASADYTRATLRGGGPVPLLPPLRLRGGSELHLGNLRLRGEVEWNARQARVGANADPVDGFTLVNLGVDWHPLGSGGPLTITLDANNLLDVVARRAASETRDFVPLPGRDVRLTGKFSF